MPKDEVEAVVRDGGDFTNVGLEVFAENFFEYGFQHMSKNRDEMEEILNNLELNARQNGNDVCGAVMGKAVLLTFKRRQVVTDALSYLSRAAEKGIQGAAAELCAWYAGRITANDLGSFPNADVGLDDCYDPTPEFPRQTFPRNLTECRRRLVYWLAKTSEADFDDIKDDFRALTGSTFDMPDTWTVYKKCRMKTEDNKSGEEAANKKRKRAEEKAWYSSLTITKDGTIYGQAYPEDDFMILDVSEAFENFNVEYVFRNADGSIYPLWKTPVRSMADPDALKERMQAVENAETREYQVYEKEKVGGKDRYVLDENGNKIPKLDENGNPIIKKRRKNGGGWASYGVTTTFLRGFVEIGKIDKGKRFVLFMLKSSQWH